MSTRIRALRSVTIANGQSLSAAIDLGGFEVEAIHMPDAWTTAELTFQAAIDAAGTYANVYNDQGDELTVAAAAARAIPLASPDCRLNGLHFIKVRSGTAGTPVEQQAARVLTLVLKAKG